ncbi:MAG: hypothetical protein K1X78_12510 [Verrucomicrobiaceae bacterium]|nr:hypothetical protein [Verrucomicrobiaceae bacterium]
MSQGVGHVANTAHDVTDDTVAYGGRVTDRQARAYTNIAFHSARRANDLAFRESNRYTDYALDTTDKAADLEVREVKRWPKFASKSAERAFGSARKAYQASMTSYGDAVDRSYWSFWNIFNPPETKSWMVGSKNDCLKCCGPFAPVPGGVWTKDLVVEEPPPPMDESKSSVRITK